MLKKSLLKKIKKSQLTYDPDKKQAFVIPDKFKTLVTMDSLIEKKSNRQLVTAGLKPLPALDYSIIYEN